MNDLKELAIRVKRLEQIARAQTDALNFLLVNSGNDAQQIEMLKARLADFLKDGVIDGGEF